MGRTILLIDDDLDILATTASMLKKRGFDVLPSSDAESALNILRSDHPDLIITDVLLPHMNGFEFVKQLRAGVFTADIPVLVITGRAQMKESFDVIGVDGFIHKPFTPDDMIQKIDEILNIKKIRDDKGAQRYRRVCVVGRACFSDVIQDIQSVLSRFGCEVVCTYSVSDAVAKTIECDPDAFVVDVQLEGKHSSEFVDIIRHLPRCEHRPMVGFCYYRLSDLSDDACRKQVSMIEDDARRFMTSGANVYIGRYGSDRLVSAFKDLTLNI